MRQHEIKKQRMIGKQMMIVDIIQLENKSGMFYSSVTIDKLAAWASIAEEEIEILIGYCQCLHILFLAQDTAHDCSKDPVYQNDRNAFYYIVSICMKYGYKIVSKWNLNQLSEDFASMSEVHYAEYLRKHGESSPVGESFARKEVFGHTIACFVRRYVDIINDALEDGYDWDVINRMQGFPMSKKRFKKLQTMISDNGHAREGLQAVAETWKNSDHY